MGVMEPFSDNLKLCLFPIPAASECFCDSNGEISKDQELNVEGIISFVLFLISLLIMKEGLLNYQLSSLVFQCFKDVGQGLDGVFMRLK